MKRDMDLVREILILIEDDVCAFGAGHGEARLAFPEADVMEHLRLMEQAGLIEVASHPLSGPIYVRGLTWTGHDFLDTVRDPEVWKRTKEGASKMGGWTFGLLKDLGTAYLKHVAKERLGLDI
ncbi:DUF2513 domain-containing protein [Methylobacterium sp. NPDC080182]|uniref:DUF2513 domain-containing protein n=1 Tax=Methylobacterium sp. NPDC080182 TaxID=3390590 RepID=UPI003CFD439B